VHPHLVHASQFLAHICCGQMAAGIMMLFGMEVGLGPSDIVLDARSLSEAVVIFSRVHAAGSTNQLLPFILGASVGIGVAVVVCVIILLICCCCRSCPMYGKCCKNGEFSFRYVHQSLEWSRYSSCFDVCLCVGVCPDSNF